LIRRQFALPSKKADGSPSLKWSEASAPDPTVDGVASKYRTWTLVATRSDGFSNIVDFLNRLPPNMAPTFIRNSGLKTDEAYSADAPPGAAAFSNGAVHGLSGKVAPIRAFASDVHVMHVALDAIRSRYQASLPPDLFDGAQSDQLLAALSKELNDLVFDTFPRRVKAAIPAVSDDADAQADG